MIKFDDTLKYYPHPVLGEFLVRIYRDVAFCQLNHIIKRVMKYSSPSLSTEMKKRVSQSKNICYITSGAGNKSKCLYINWQGMLEFGKLSTKNPDFKKRQESVLEFADWLREVERLSIEGTEEAIFALANKDKEESKSDSKVIIPKLKEGEVKLSKPEEVITSTTPPKKKYTPPKCEPITTKIDKDDRYDRNYKMNYQPGPSVSIKDVDFSVIDWEMAARERENEIIFLLEQLEKITHKSAIYWRGLAQQNTRKY